jgi:hypothetical protein
MALYARERRRLLWETGTSKDWGGIGEAFLVKRSIHTGRGFTMVFTIVRALLKVGRNTLLVEPEQFPDMLRV